MTDFEVSTFRVDESHEIIAIWFKSFHHVGLDSCSLFVEQYLAST